MGKVGMNVAAVSGKQNGDEVSRQELAAMLEKFSAVENKLLKLEEQDRFVLKNLSDNLKILRDWSESVENRIAQSFETFSKHAAEIEKWRESGRFLGEKVINLEEKMYKSRKLA